MDIERLKEHDLYVLRAVVSGLEEEQSIDFVITRQFEKVIDEAIARRSVASDEVAEAIEELSQASDRMHYAQDGAHVKTPISLATIDLAITALEKIGTNTVDVAWTEAYQSYESAGDEAVPYCPKCDADLEDDQKFCKDCGVELIWSWDKEIK